MNWSWFYLHQPAAMSSEASQSIDGADVKDEAQDAVWFPKTTEPERSSATRRPRSQTPFMLMGEQK